MDVRYQVGTAEIPADLHTRTHLSYLGSKLPLKMLHYAACILITSDNATLDVCACPGISSLMLQLILGISPLGSQLHKHLTSARCEMKVCFCNSPALKLKLADAL